MSFNKIFAYLCMAFLASASTLSKAQADDTLRTAIIYDMGGKFDQSFNQLAYEGAMAFQKDTGLNFTDHEPRDDADHHHMLDQFAASKDYDLIITLGFSHAAAVKKAATTYPDQRFVIIDAVVDMPNVQSILFKENEGAFLVGLLAAMKSKSGTIGFIGGMDIPVIRKFASGYEDGARYINPNITLLTGFLGTNTKAWISPPLGHAKAKEQAAAGADIIFAAAGPSGRGVIEAARNGNFLAIGVDSNQNHLAPGDVLTSMLKRIDHAVYQSMMSAQNGTWQAGTHRIGLKEGGVGYALDQHNQSLIAPAMRARLSEAEKAIIEGRLKLRTIKESDSAH